MSMSEGVVGVICTTVFTVVIVLGAWGLNSFVCHNKWGDLGHEVRWKIFAGCQIEHTPGQWIPAEAFRVIP